MIDIKYLRENAEKVQKSAKDKGVEIDVAHILEIDSKKKELDIKVQSLRETRNKAAKEQDIEKGKSLKVELEIDEKALKAVDEELQNWLLKIPNPALEGVPIGDETKFELIRTEGEPTKFNFNPKDHLEIGEKLGIIDIEKAAKISGSRFAYLKGEAVLLEFALVNFALENLTKVGFVPVVPPVLIKKEITNGLGYWERGNHNNYYLVTDYEEIAEGKERENQLYLVGTAEHALVPMHKDETLQAKDLPIKYAGFSSAFRREAGTYGKDTRGILRVHQFDKVEMVEFVKPEDDEKERRAMLALSEKLLQLLELPYRVVKLASQDIAFPTAETIDIETWLPSQDKYRESHSISTTTDFQARRLNIKYQNGDEKGFVHILNGTAFAIGRTIIAILENYQEAGGSVRIPEVLQKYMGGIKKIEKKP